MALQLKPLFLRRPFTATLAELNNLGVPKHKDEEEPTLIAPLVTELEIETQLIIIIVSISSASSTFTSASVAKIF